MTKTQQKHASRAALEKTPIIEWALGAIGVALFVGCVAFLIYEGVVNGEKPGPVTASVIEIAAAGNHHIVTFSIHNSGTQTLSNLQVSARLLDGEKEVESATTTIDYLPGRSSQEGGFYFEHDPRTLKLEIAPEGYQKP